MAIRNFFRNGGNLKFHILNEENDYSLCDIACYTKNNSEMWQLDMLKVSSSVFCSRCLYVEKQCGNCEDNLVIRYQLRRNESTKKYSRVYRYQCSVCSMLYGDAIPMVSIQNIIGTYILDSGNREDDKRNHEWALDNIPIPDKAKIYKKYLSSNRWKAKREIALKRDKYMCQVCYMNEADHVHHLTYENLGNENPEDLLSVCTSCHSKLHKKKDLQRWR